MTLGKVHHNSITLTFGAAFCSSICNGSWSFITPALELSKTVNVENSNLCLSFNCFLWSAKVYVEWQH